MAYSLQIGLRYLRSKKRPTVSMITIVSIVGVALGVAALLAVLSITTGFERAFRDRVLGVNAHVLVLKYGRDFQEYRDVLEKVNALEEVAGAAPFVINEMMLAKEDRLSGVLVKGVTPEGVDKVLDLPQQIVTGELKGLRREGAAPFESNREATDDWEWLEKLKKEPTAPGRTTWLSSTTSGTARRSRTWTATSRTAGTRRWRRRTPAPS